MNSDQPDTGSLRGYPLRAFAICFASLTFASMDQALFGYAVPAIREEFGINLGLAIGPLVASYPIGWLGWNAAFSYFVAIPLFLPGLVFLTLESKPSGVEVEEIAT